MNRHVKAYVYAVMYFASEAKAKRQVIESFQPFAKTHRRQIGRAIRTGRRVVRKAVEG